MNGGGKAGLFADVTLERLNRDIKRYERKAAELARVTTPRQINLRSLYQTLATNRKELLAALRDGHPELWTDGTGRQQPSQQQ